MDKAPKKRLTATEALKHSFFKPLVDLSEDKHVKLDKDVIKKLLEYRGQPKLKTAVANLLVRNLEQDQFKELRKQFELLDTDKTGLLASA